MKLKKSDLLLVTWLDCWSDYGWHPRDEDKLSEMRCYSLGHLQSVNETQLEISQSISLESKGNTLTIPRKCIISISKLKVGSETRKELDKVWRVQP